MIPISVFFLLSASFFDGYLAAPAADQPQAPVNLCLVTLDLMEQGVSGDSLKQRLMQEAKSGKYDYYGYESDYYDQDYYGNTPYGYDEYSTYSQYDKYPSKYEDTYSSTYQYNDQYDEGYSTYKPANTYNTYQPNYKSDSYDTYGYDCYGYNCKKDAASGPQPELQVSRPAAPSSRSASMKREQGSISLPSTTELQAENPQEIFQAIDKFINYFLQVYPTISGGGSGTLREKCAHLPAHTKITDLIDVVRNAAVQI